ncbi:Golgi apyrase [Allomyces arbusculus]|nr:Golgi apyrase [Allomyces arbusculus]
MPASPVPPPPASQSMPPADKAAQAEWELLDQDGVDDQRPDGATPLNDNTNTAEPGVAAADAPSGDSEETQYAIVIDAGSSGSRVQVFSLQPSKHGLPEFGRAMHPSFHDWQLKTEPGVSSFADHPHDVGSSLAPLLKFAMGIVPAHLHASTPLRVLATAGMRLLPLHKQTAVVDAVCNVLRNYPFAAAPSGCHETVRVISGEDEGLFGWLALNYLTRSFHDAKRKPLGFLDMGGASTQIAFSVPPASADTVSADPEETRTTHPAPYKVVHVPTAQGAVRPFAVHVTTFLGMGTNEARKTHVRELAAKAADPTSSAEPLIADPCLAPGLELTEHLDADDHGVARSVTLAGRGSFDACRALTDAQLHHEHSCAPGSGACLVRADLNQTFVGVSEYWYSTYDMLGLGGAYVPEVFSAHTRAFCAQPWDSPAHRAAAAAGVAESRLQAQCFKAAWIASVLHVGFGIPEAALPSSSTETVGPAPSVCPVAEKSILGPAHVQVPPPVHVKAHETLFRSPAAPTTPAVSVNGSCVRPEIHVLTSDHVGDMQVTWTLGSLLYDRVRAEPIAHQSPPVLPPSPPAPVAVTPDNVHLDALFDDPRSATDSTHSMPVAVLLLIFVAGLVAYLMRRPRSPTEAYYYHYAGLNGESMSVWARVRHLAWRARMKLVGAKRAASGSTLLASNADARDLDAESSAYRLFDQRKDVVRGPGGAGTVRGVL